MIVTFTMNPAIDRTLLIPDFEPGKVNHVGITITDAGGNGVNVCRALKIMGTDSMTCGFIAGKNGRFIKDTLSSLNIPYDFVDVPGETRINIKIVDRNGLHTDINESGFEINETDFNRLKERLTQYVRRDNSIVLCGSTPPNFTVERYGQICQMISARSCELFLDTSGKLLLEGLKAKPVYVKPNVQELEATLGDKFTTHEDICRGARELIGLGAQNVVVSMGAEGAIFMNESQTLFVEAPKVPVRGPVGAGDVMMAGIVHARQNRMDFETTACYAVAAASASVTVEGTRMAQRRDVLKLFPSISAVRI
ncbi:MAG: 1-phosphofructokinase [Clostridiaceae bacterium]|nr:1-phosphofructokinase [Clostridiaceae bacterium]